jgi:multidrug efflux pump subunit AcrA (membrane-fusion protein)
MTPHLIALVAVAGAVPSTQQNQDLGQTIKEAVDQATREATQGAQEAAREAAQEAQQAAREAQQQVREAQQQVREAQQQVRDAQQQLRDARTPDQQGAAHQAMMEAQQALNVAQVELQRIQGQMQSPRVVYTTTQPPFFQQPTIPPQAVDIAIGFFVTCAVIVVGWPISRALGRRFEKRGTTPLLDASVADQLQRIEQAVEAVAIEVERISESQRFLARLQEKSPSTVE